METSTISYLKNKRNRENNNSVEIFIIEARYNQDALGKRKMYHGPMTVQDHHLTWYSTNMIITLEFRQIFV